MCKNLKLLGNNKMKFCDFNCQNVYAVLDHLQINLLLNISEISIKKKKKLLVIFKNLKIIFLDYIN